VAFLWLGVRIGRLTGAGALWGCVTLYVVGRAAVPAAVCRLGLCPRCPRVGGVTLGGKHIPSRVNPYPERKKVFVRNCQDIGDQVSMQPHDEAAQ